MESNLLKGKPVADRICEDIAKRVQNLNKKSVIPTLAIVRVGNKPDDIYYERSAIKRMDGVGIKVKSLVFDNDIYQQELEKHVHDLSNNASINGILILMPLPKHLSEKDIKACICPTKDIDGLTDKSMLGLYDGTNTGFEPCTPGAVMELLEYNNIDLYGKNVVILGRSLVVGKPLSMLMLNKNATVTICHSKTKNIKELCRQADILVAAVGKAKMVTDEYVSKNTIVIDVGINQDENGNMCGDVDFESVSKVVHSITPVPGGIGSITTAVLAKHVVISAENTNI